MVFMHIELFVFDLPARTPNTHDGGDIIWGDLHVREPGIVIELLTLSVMLPDLHQGPPQATRGRQGYRGRDTVGGKTPSTRRPFMPLTC